jgi:acetyl-CoA acetyltransferase
MINPRAVFRDELTMDDYLAARWISTPLCLFDCDVPLDGSTAVIVSSADYAPDAPQPPVQVHAIGSAWGSRPRWDEFADVTDLACAQVASHMWSRTDLEPHDVDVALLYDGFSILTLQWIEALGFCGRGEGGAYIEGGRRIARDGELPLNTHGGQLSEGRLHGFGFIHEAVVQLRGDGGERQVAGGPEVAVVSNSGGPSAGCALLTRWRG